MHLLPSRDEAREDTAAYHRALITNRTSEALRIERKYGLDGLPPQIVSIGLHAATEGRCAWEAVEEYMEGEDS